MLLHAAALVEQMSLQQMPKVPLLVCRMQRRWWQYPTLENQQVTTHPLGFVKAVQ